MSKRVITIGRQFGSGGRMIGKQIAEALNYKFFDKELLAQAAKDTGYCEGTFLKADEKGFDPFAYAALGAIPSFGMSFNRDVLTNEKLFLLQCKTIENIAESSESVIIGRCANYVLRKRPDVLSIFICDSYDNRVNRVMKRYDVTEHVAKKMIRTKDKTRSSYYNFYTDTDWGLAENYDMCLNLGRLGEEKIITLIQKACIKL